MTFTSNPLTRVGLAGICLVLTVGACSGSQKTQAPRGAGSTPPADSLPSAASSTPPLEGDEQRVTVATDLAGSDAATTTPDSERPYGPSGDALIWNVREKLTRRCMGEAGFDYIINPPPVNNAPDPIPRLSVSDAEQHGYRGSLTSEPEPEPQVAADADDPAYAEALDPQSDSGEPGCFESAYQELLGTSETASAIDLFRAIEGQDITLVVETTPEFSTLLNEWATCMNQQGYDYSNPGAAFFQFAGPESTTPPGDAPSDEERATATADAQCRESIDYEQRYQALYEAHSASWANEHAAELQEVREQEQADLERAAQVAAELDI